MSAMAHRVLRARPPHPRLSRRGRLRAARRRRAAGLQRVAGPAAARGARGAHARAAARSTATPTRPTRALRRALSDRYGVPADRIAIGNGSCDILLAAGEALLEPGAELVYAWPSFSRLPAPRGRVGRDARSRVPLDAAHRHDLDAMPAEITVATRLVIVCNPNNPTSTALPLDAIAAFVERVPRHVAVILDEAYCEFNLARRPRRVGRPAARPPQPRPAAHVLQGLRALRPARRLRAVRRRGLRARRRPGPPAVLLQRRRAGRRRRGAAPPGRGRRPRRAGDRRRASSSRTACARLGIEPAESQANFAWFDLPASGDDEPAEVEERVVRGLAERGVLVRAGTALGRAGALRVTYGTPAENERFLARWASCSRATRAAPATPRAARAASAPAAPARPSRPSGPPSGPAT